jgi:hypothetical protein
MTFGVLYDRVCRPTHELPLHTPSMRIMLALLLAKAMLQKDRNCEKARTNA